MFVGVITHASGIKIKDVVQLRFLANFKQLVDLLLVLSKGKMDFGVLQDIDHLGGN